MNELPDEVLEMIFELVDLPKLLMIIRRVCRRWYRLSRSPWVLRTIHFSCSQLAMRERVERCNDNSKHRYVNCHYGRLGWILRKDRQHVKRIVFHGNYDAEQVPPPPEIYKIAFSVLRFSLKAVELPYMYQLVFINFFLDTLRQYTGMHLWTIPDSVRDIVLQNWSIKLHCAHLKPGINGWCCDLHANLTDGKEIKVTVPRRYVVAWPPLAHYEWYDTAPSFLITLEEHLRTSFILPLSQMEMKQFTAWFAEHPDAASCALQTLRNLCTWWNWEILAQLQEVEDLMSADFAGFKPVVLRLMEIWQASYPT